LDKEGVAPHCHIGACINTKHKVRVFIPIASDESLALVLITGGEQTVPAHPGIGLQVEGVDAPVKIADAVEQRLKTNPGRPVTKLTIGVDPLIGGAITE